MPTPRPITLPLGLQPLLERVAATYLNGPNDSPSIDFTAPAGEAALAGPDSISWQVFRNPVSLFVGGVAAVLLELAEPRVREGVWTHSRFRTDPVARLQRTGLAAMVTVYGPRSVAERMIAGIVRTHEGVTGTVPGGAPYRANDPDLLRWVHATAAYGFLEAYLRLVEPLGPAECDQYYAEGIEAGRLYGVPDPPASRAALDDCLQAMRPELEASPVIDEFLRIMRRAPILPRGLRPVQAVLVRAAVDLLPGWTRERLRLTDVGRPTRPERQLVRAAARMVQQLRLDGSPAAQACARLGLPRDYLQARWTARQPG